ncbi:MAG: hypothetical protein LVQ63_06415 [Thermoplasmatales archaeon]|nr:hypothetical protein [Thermoplasmatales archaeon]
MNFVNGISESRYPVVLLGLLPASYPFSIVEMEEPEIIDYETKDITKGVRVTLKDGTILEVMLKVNSIIKIGHDANNGAPVYNVNVQYIIKTKSILKELFKKVKGKAPSDDQ